MSIQVSFLVLPYNLASISEVDKIKYLQSSLYSVYNKQWRILTKYVGGAKYLLYIYI
jgi:hypothetical protein